MSSYEALLIPAEEAEPVRRVTINNSDSGLTDLQGHVGGHIQAIDFLDDEKVTCYINEDGKGGQGVTVMRRETTRYNRAAFEAFCADAVETLKHHYGESNEKLTPYFLLPNGGSL
jgi:hypothetical protein